MQAALRDKNENVFPQDFIDFLPSGAVGETKVHKVMTPF